MCDCKSYGSYKAAKTALNQTKRSPTCNHTRPIRIYHCDKCHAWHLTSEVIAERHYKKRRKRGFA